MHYCLTVKGAFLTKKLKSLLKSLTNDEQSINSMSIILGITISKTLRNLSSIHATLLIVKYILKNNYRIYNKRYRSRVGADTNRTNRSRHRKAVHYRLVMTQHRYEITPGIGTELTRIELEQIQE